MSDVMLSGYYKGNKETGVYYKLVSTPMQDGTKVYAILRDYGNMSDGTPCNSVSVVCIDDGTVESYNRACQLFLLFMGC